MTCVRELGLASSLNVTANSMENARYRVKLNAGGDIASIFDKTVERELPLRADAALLPHGESRAVSGMEYGLGGQGEAGGGFVGGPAIFGSWRTVPPGGLGSGTNDGKFDVQPRIRLWAGSAGDRVEVLDRIDWRVVRGEP